MTSTQKLTIGTANSVMKGLVKKEIMSGYQAQLANPAFNVSESTKLPSQYKVQPLLGQ